MATPLPADPLPEPIPGPYPRLVPDDDRAALRVLPPPDTEPDHDPDPYWTCPRLSAVRTALPLAWDAPVDDDAAGADLGEHPPGAQRAAWRLVNGYLEVLAGRRPASQLAGPATPAAARQLIQVAPNPQLRLRLFRLHVIEQLPGRAEVVVLLTDLDRGQVLAIALRLVHADGAWRCADFQGIW